MKLCTARRDFISAISKPRKPGYAPQVEIRYQVVAGNETHGFDQELVLTMDASGRCTPFMQIEGVPQRPTQEEAVQRLADHLEMMAKALRATDTRKRAVKVRALPIHCSDGGFLRLHSPGGDR